MQNLSEEEHQELNPSEESDQLNQESAAEEQQSEPAIPNEIPDEDIKRFIDAVDRLRDELAKVIVGQDKAIDLLLTGLLSDGHVLLEGVPGIAKTLLAKLLSRSLELDFSRIQFTPDLMPSDVIGTSVFNLQSSVFEFKSGPIFSNVVLIDEINRAPAKTQAALFEVMEERQISHDGERYLLEEPFLVIATQNPIEQEGTYRLPEAQLDRFIFRIKMDYPSLDEEKTILKQFRSDFKLQKGENIEAVLGREDIAKLRGLVEKVHISDALCDYIGEIVYATRNTGSLYLGASPRASLSILRASKAYALLGGRSFVTPDDVKSMCEPVLNHRIMLSSERELEGVEVEQVVNEIVQSVEVPR
jgi:MoxR-like ATPase